MDITLDKKTPTEALIKITLKETDYQPKVEEKLKEYSKKASIKGFRPGKVPSGLIKKMYGKSILIDEINHLLSHSLTDYIKSNDLKILGEPLPNFKEGNEIDWDNQKEFEFIYNIGLVDNFDFKLDDNIQVNKYKIDIDEKYLQESIDNLLNQFGNSKEAELSEAKDQLFGTLKQDDAQIEKEILLPLEDVTESERQIFIGKKAEDEISFDIKKTLRDEEKLSELLEKSPEEVSQLTGTFSFTIKKISRNAPAELNQEFFDKVFGKDTVSSEEEFMQKVKDTIQENYNRETENFLNHEIKEKIVANTEIATPDDFLKRWLIETNEGKVTKEDVEKEYDLYIKELKWNLIQNKIMEENDLKVEHDEVLERSKELLRKQFMQYGGGIQMDDIVDKYAEEYLKADKGENYMRLFNQVKGEKILELIQQKIKIEYKPVNLEEFKKVASN
ncbi:MAG: trigger factor [Bacteroidota bacterium]|nr:trigger factor [Bacteroidota bacterium]